MGNYSDLSREGRMEEMSQRVSTIMHHFNKNQVVVNHLETNVPQWVVKVGIVLMLMGAVANNISYVTDVLDSITPWIAAICHCIECLIMYGCMILGMRNLRRPYTFPWLLAFLFDVLGTVTGVYHPTTGFLFFVLSALLVVPFGVMIALKYRGTLRYVGVYMAARLLLSCALQALMRFLNENILMGIHLYVCDIALCIVDIILAFYVWRLLVSSN